MKTKKQTISTYVILSVIISLFALTSSYAQEKEHLLKGIMTFNSEVIDYGSITKNSNGIRVFSFTNTGSAPIVISKIKSTCGCTIPDYKKAAILPGETSEISVKYATNRIGAFSKSITVFSNASEEKKILKIKGTILNTNAKS